MDLKIGDVVMVNNQNVEMTVESTHTIGTNKTVFVRVVWFNKKGDLHRDEFNSKMLVKV